MGKLGRTAWGVVAVGLLTGGCAAEATDGETEVRAATRALGETTDGFPNWSERVVHVWTNRARCDPAADLAGCTVCAESACYAPVPPLLWDHNLGRAARFHSDNLVLGGCGLQHDSPCTVVSDIDTQYDPGPCSGAPSCACVGGSATCGSGGTPWSTRISLFGTSPRAENIARGRADPVMTLYQWLWEPDSNPACGWRSANGHRANILGTSRSLGVGRAAGGSTWTQDFGSTGTPSGIVSGVHYPQTGASLAFRANWYSSGGPTTAMVSVEGTCSPLTLERGSATNGTFLATVGGIGSGCTRYFFHFTDGSGDVFYPSTGSYGIGCAYDWSATRPAPCGACTPDCSGRSCGDDGCGGSCGTCGPGLTCNASGTCVCAGMVCSGSCVDTTTDPTNCGGCGVTCAGGEACIGGTCRCAGDCSGRVCGDDGCGGSCGACPSERTCDASGACVCTTGTECGGACVDTDTDRRNCGSCGNRCRGREFCVAGTCGTSCTPDCTGRTCGSDGCGGSCGSCPMGQTCDSAGACVCPMGTADCGGACVDTSTDPAHCGGCGMACAGGESCVGGSCTSACVPDCAGRSCGDDGCGGSCGSCPAMATCDGAGACVCGGGTTMCGGSCVDTDTSAAHCGACGTACAAGEVCSGGACSCVPSCGGRTCGADGCGGTCGTCGAGRLCSGGACVCDAALTECGAACVDVRTDDAHCGACDAACDSGESCTAGTCSMAGPDAGCMPACDGRDCGDDTCGGSCGACDTGRVCGAGGLCLCDGDTTDCGGVCIDTRIDGAHCGACDAACAPGQRCVGGACEGTPTADAGMPGTDAGPTGMLDAGVPGADSGTPTEPGDDGGCGCSAPGERGAPAAPAALAILGLLAGVLRKRRR